MTATYWLRRSREDSKSSALEVQGLNISPSGLKVRSHTELAPGTAVLLESKGGHPSGRCTVRYCVHQDHVYHVGLEFSAEMKATVPLLEDENIDYYEFLQISPKAEPQTIHRIYRFMASRFHPDNPETGHAEKFLLLQRAFEVLSDPERRAEYDAIHANRETDSIPIFELSQFVNGIEGEKNRRFGVLALLYNKRRTNPGEPTVSLRDLEKQMAFPREYLDFTTWYLKSKQYITVADNSDFALTAAGVDYIEFSTSDNPMLTNILESTSQTATDTTFRKRHRPLRHTTELFQMGAASDPLPALSAGSSPDPVQQGRASGD